jgi:lipoyl(octanoyl) transferase
MLELRDLGRLGYAPCHALMLEVVEQRGRGAVPDTLLLVEHEPVYTRGRRRDAGDVLEAGLPVVDVERGGRVTWHGPGQVVAYPIVALAGRDRDLHAWLRRLEDVTIDALRDFGLAGGRDPRGTGVFTGERKIASIGIAVKRWVTYHGLALNVSCDLDAFAAIRPCGFEPEIMTSIERELAPRAPPSLAAVKVSLATACRARLVPTQG